MSEVVDLSPAKLDVRVTKGDALNGDVITFHFTDEETGNDVDLTGASFKAKIVKGSEEIDWNLTITDAAGGKAQPDVDTSNMEGLYEHYVTLVQSGGSELTYISGTVRVGDRV